MLFGEIRNENSVCSKGWRKTPSLRKSKSFAKINSNTVGDTHTLNYKQARSHAQHTHPKTTFFHRKTEAIEEICVVPEQKHEIHWETK